ncbi:MAG: STAS domain-containing protein [Chloroflexota bacterium]|nr:STAS domain-containing protein [Chloroflexota bacterium]
MATREAQTSPVGFVIDGPIDRADVPGLCDRVRVLIEGGDTDPFVCDVGGLLDSQLGTVALLARLQLTARRLGGVSGFATPQRSCTTRSPW